MKIVHSPTETQTKKVKEKMEGIVLIIWKHFEEIRKQMPELKDDFIRGIASFIEREEERIREVLLVSDKARKERAERRIGELKEELEKYEKKLLDEGAYKVVWCPELTSEGKKWVEEQKAKSPYHHFNGIVPGKFKVKRPKKVLSSQAHAYASILLHHRACIEHLTNCFISKAKTAYTEPHEETVKRLCKYLVEKAKEKDFEGKPWTGDRWQVRALYHAVFHDYLKGTINNPHIWFSEFSKDKDGLDIDISPSAIRYYGKKTNKKEKDLSNDFKTIIENKKT